MKNIQITLLLFAIITTLSCSNFLDTAPQDQLSPATFWKVEKDAYDAVTGCYNDWASGYDILYWDCTSDIGFNFHAHEGYKNIGNGSMSPSNAGSGYYDYTIIRRCNTFLKNAQGIIFKDTVTRKDLFAQVRTIRAYRYFLLNFWYGGVPIIEDYASAQEAQVPKNSEEEVKQFIYDELDAVIPDLKIDASAKGRINRATALALKMRSALYWKDYQRALDAAHDIQRLNKYNLEDNYAHLFTVTGQNSQEIIYAVPYVMSTHKMWLPGAMYNNGDGGWSSIVPTQNLVDMYEMNTGLTKDEEGSGYDPVYPFKNRDPRMEMTILYPGMDWTWKGTTRVLNTLDKEIGNEKNEDYFAAADNASKTGLTWAKYLFPASQYSDEWNTNCSPILFRYAEVLLTIAEAIIEKEPFVIEEELYDVLDPIRERAGMPVVDRAKYNSRETLRELLRRERCVEFAGEGLRRADIVRWKNTDGTMVAETVLNEPLTRIIGTINYSETDPFKRAVVTLPTDQNLTDRKIEDRIFKPINRYLPIPQSEMDKNPKLEQAYK